MKIFFDTEFTGLHKDTTLISIGMIDENDRTFYAEFTDYDKSQCDDWINDNVIKHLKYNKEDSYISNITNINGENYEVYGDKDYIKVVLNNWLLKYDNIELISDCCHYDMVLFIDIFGDAWSIPSTVNPACYDINQDISKHFNISGREAFDLSREEIINTFNKMMINWPKEIIHIEGDKHNSLYDAKVIKAIYKITNSY